MARYEIEGQTKAQSPPRKVKITEAGGTVRILVNGAMVARFTAGDDHLEIFDPVTPITGLEKGPNGLLKVR